MARLNKNTEYLPQNNHSKEEIKEEIRTATSKKATTATTTTTIKHQKRSKKVQEQSPNLEQKEKEHAPIQHPFERLMNEYPTYKHCFDNIGLLTANGMSFPHEINEIKKYPTYDHKNSDPDYDYKLQQEIAKNKAMLQLQVQCSIKGGDAILGLQLDFTKSDIGVCICTAYGTAIKYKTLKSANSK